MASRSTALSFSAPTAASTRSISGSRTRTIFSVAHRSHPLSRRRLALGERRPLSPDLFLDRGTYYLDDDAKTNTLPKSQVGGWHDFNPFVIKNGGQFYFGLGDQRPGRACQSLTLGDDPLRFTMVPEVLIDTGVLSSIDDTFAHNSRHLP